MNVLADYGLKRDRAEQHLTELRESVQRFDALEYEPVRGEFEPEDSRYRFEIPLPRVDPLWPTLVGDLIYNLRAGIDYMIAALVRSNGGEETSSSAFPISGFSPDRLGKPINEKEPDKKYSWMRLEEEWDKDRNGRIGRSLRGTPEGTKAAIKSLQPFYGVPKVNPMKHPLFVLWELSNRDKHRRLNLLARRAELPFVDASGDRIYVGPAPAARLREALGADSYLVDLKVKEPHETDVFIHPSYEVVFDEAPVAIGPVIDEIERVSDYIDESVAPTVKSLMRSSV